MIDISAIVQLSTEAKSFRIYYTQYLQEYFLSLDSQYSKK
ncbi:hypothetical protein SAMN00777080_3599 [Aquiflexum balticum DSM 16537]|uniref:Uncharacterized protein n=1 Tax=Aquiflexum balticum DSM 16537 TaxID=758820 RepID=A0A1W2H7S6_9BACT|nr:hypothetical protein SAMN00777080_3599 [Aquiflexum balticum DSM 16537]